MFIGHFGLGFAAKRVAPRVSLGTAFLAAQFLDLLWPTFLLLGVESVRIAPGATAVTPLIFDHYPISHSLAAVIGWGLALGAIYALTSKNTRGAFVVAALVVSHWLLDAIVHVPDLPLVPGGDTLVGLGLWQSKAATLAVEIPIFAAGVWLYARATRAKDKVGRYGLIGLVAFLALVHVGSLFGAPPPNVTALAWVGQAQWLLVAWGYWVDAHRDSRLYDDIVAYVSNADSRDISVLKLDHDKGALQVLQTLDVGGTVMPIALSPDKRMLYAALRSEPYSVASFAINGSTGSLKRVGTAPLPDSMANIVTDRTGRWLFAASYGGNKISVSPIGADGVAGPAVAVLPTGKNAHAAIIDAANKNLFVTNLGSDQILQYRFDAATGKLAPNDPPAFGTRPGAGPRHLVLHPDGRHAYVLHELDATVDLLAYDAQRGILSLSKTWSTLPSGFSGKPWAADLHLTPDGRFLYTSERNSNTLAMWSVDAASGELKLIGHQPTEKQPRGFQIDPSGAWLLAVGQLSNGMTAYRIDPASGRLTPQASLPLGKNPNWVEIIDLP